ANPPPKGAEIHVEEQGVNDPEQDHQQRGRVFPVSQQCEREHKAGGGQAISGKTSGLDIILQRQRRKLQSKPEVFPDMAWPPPALCSRSHCWETGNTRPRCW